ncbi:acyltransferase [Xylaria palmicola]|nr:acyltransferase [Xylaria palmicola]
MSIPSSTSSNTPPPPPSPPPPADRPGLPWRMTSSLVMGLTASLSRVFLYGLNTVEVTGLRRFLDVLDARRDVDKRQRGLITVCNHISVFDDPLMWGVLPFGRAFDPSNNRWGLGAHDICFKNDLLGAFFAAGQVLPTHRLQHSPHGGLFQPTVSQAIRLLSSQPFVRPAASPGDGGGEAPDEAAAAAIPGFPPIYARDRHSWVHVFPEACVHQHPRLSMRYFKWGVSRLILESEPMPDVVPIFVDGTQRVMPEDRGWPRFLPRAGVRLRVAFGAPVDAERTFGDLRAQWRELVRQQRQQQEAEAEDTRAPAPRRALGELPDELKYGEKAVRLRIEVARRVREEVLKVRRSLGYPDEEPTGSELAETWTREPGKDKFKSNVDGSLVNKRQ